MRESISRAGIMRCEDGAELGWVSWSAHRLPSGPEYMSALISRLQASDKEEKNSDSFSAKCIAMADSSGSVLK